MRSCRWLLRETKPRLSLAGQSARWPWLGEGRRKSGKREEVNEEERGGKESGSGKQRRESKDEERGGKESGSGKQRRESKDEERGGRSGVGRRERN